MGRAARIATLIAVLASCDGGGGERVSLRPAHGRPALPADAGTATDAPLSADAAATPHPELGRKLGDLFSEHDDYWASLEWLIEHPVESREPLRNIVASDRYTVAKRRAYVALGRIGDARDVPFLAERMRDDPDELMRFPAAEALAEHDSEEAEVALMQGLAGPDAQVTADAAVALGIRKSEDARARLEVLLDHADRIVRFSVVRALGKLGHPPSAAALRKRARVEKDSEVRKALKEMGY
jgi:hypothetical protein